MTQVYADQLVPSQQLCTAAIVFSDSCLRSLVQWLRKSKSKRMGTPSEWRTERGEGCGRIRPDPWCCITASKVPPVRELDLRRNIDPLLKPVCLSSSAMASTSRVASSSCCTHPTVASTWRANRAAIGCSAAPLRSTGRLTPGTGGAEATALTFCGPTPMAWLKRST
eukprot:CAMPEP_0171078280 /NCGR_PEP_ID=MMETSP0766_2-20121228/14551_1 /TAXON_ID=439317 /ORGANISM="Gambierdiscus australes, Strain CAWD 149" /LENGTH=166 /DNA_ID=CAMNT_0011535397 /DNA_START=32 /DNA_END=530 /DNA_ORIENTATION=-